MQGRTEQRYIAHICMNLFDRFDALTDKFSLFNLGLDEVFMLIDVAERQQDHGIDVRVVVEKLHVEGKE